MTAKNMSEAWNMVNELFPTDYYENTAKTANAGYPIYDSTLGDENGYICDLGCRLEINFADGRSVNIWIEEAEAEAEEATQKYITFEINSVLFRNGAEVSEKFSEALTLSAGTTFAEIRTFEKRVKKAILNARKNTKNGASVSASLAVGYYSVNNGIIHQHAFECWNGDGESITEDGIHLTPDERYNSDLCRDFWLTGNGSIFDELTI
jgi:hypothetical protein